MRVFRAWSIVLVAVALLLSSAGESLAWPGRVVSVTDGDTIKVLDPGGQEVKIRLYGVDTPEKKQAFGHAAREFTAGLVAGKMVEVEPVDTDRYGRVVGIVHGNGFIVNRELVKSGFAWVYPQYCRRAECREWVTLEGEARRQRAGLWAEPDAVPPWDWRRQK